MSVRFEGIRPKKVFTCTLCGDNSKSGELASSAKVYCDNNSGAIWSGRICKGCLLEGAERVEAKLMEKGNTMYEKNYERDKEWSEQSSLAKAGFYLLDNSRPFILIEML